MALSTTVRLEVVNDTTAPARLQIEYVGSDGKTVLAFPDGEIVPPGSAAREITVELEGADTSKSYTVYVNGTPNRKAFAASNTVALTVSRDGPSNDSFVWTLLYILLGTMVVGAACAYLYYYVYVPHRRASGPAAAAAPKNSEAPVAATAAAAYTGLYTQEYMTKYPSL